MKEALKQPPLSKSLALLQSERGMTLTEILVTLALIAIVMGVGLLYVFPSDVSKAKEDARRLVGTIRLAYNEAVLNQKYVKLVFDIDKKSYYIESSPTAFLIEKTSPDEKIAANTENEEENNNEVSESPQENILFAPEKLNSDIKFKDIMVAHADKPIESGKEAMHFLPIGWAEPTVINLSNEDEKVFFSIKVNPLTGKAEIRDEYYEPEEKELSTGS